MIGKNNTSGPLTVGLDCSGESYSVAVCRAGQCLAEFGGLSTRSHLRRLLPSLVECLKSLQMTARDVEVIAVTQGPGSFTGLRLGIVTAKTMAQVLGCRLVGVDTLAALAASMPGYTKVCAAMDARRGEIFAAFFDTTGPLPKRLSEDKAYAAADFAKFLQDEQAQAVGGSSTVAYRQSLAADFSGFIFPDAWSQVRALHVAALAEESADSNGNLMPVYLRSAEVQVQPCHMPKV